MSSACWPPPGWPLVTNPVCYFHGQDLKEQPGEENIRFGVLRVVSLLYVDDAVLLASLHPDLLQALERFAVKCEAVGMRVSTSKSEAVVL